MRHLPRRRWRRSPGRSWPEAPRSVGAGGYAEKSLPGTSTELNTTSNDGCPIESPDGLSLYSATNRPGGLGGIDIWAAHRSSTDGAFGAFFVCRSISTGSADYFCPTPVSGKGLFFVSSRVIPWRVLVAPISTSPASTQPRARPIPSISAARSTVPAARPGHPISKPTGRVTCTSQAAPTSTPAPSCPMGSSIRQQQLPSCNDPVAGDFRPNVSKNGMEIVFDSNRVGTAGGQDIYIATRSSTGDPWSTPVNAGPNLNTAAMETRASFSRDGSRMYFGRTPGPEGGSDIFVSTR